MNAIERIVRVLFKGEDGVTPEAGKAEKAIAGFGASAMSVMKGLGAIVAGLALGAFFKKAVEEAQASRVAMGQLAIAVDNSGASFRAMEPSINDTITKLARLTAFGDDDFVSAMQAMTLKTGDAAWALDNLGQAADLAAAAGIPLEQASQALAKAHEGNTKALFQMVPQIKHATDWQVALAEATRGAAEEQAKALGPFAAIEKQYGEVVEAVGKAILGNEQLSSSGNLVADMLGELASWIEANGTAMTGMLSVALQVGETFAVVLAPTARIVATALLTLNLVVQELWNRIQRLAPAADGTVGKMLVAFGTLVEKGGGMLKAFGITVVEGWGKKMKEHGAELVANADKTWADLDSSQKRFLVQFGGTWQAIWSDAKKQADKGGDDIADGTREGFRKAGDATEAGAARMQKAIDEKLGKPLKIVIEATTTAIGSLADAAEKQLPAEAADKFKQHMEGVAKHAKEVEDRITGASKPLSDNTDSTRKMWSSVEGVARGALDAAQAFGLMDKEAASTLDSVINIASSIGRIYAGDVVGGATGLAGGIANLVAAMSNTENKQLVRSNTEALRRLRDEVSGLDLNIKGEDFASAEGVLSKIVPMLAGKSIGDQARLMPEISRMLQAAGLSSAELLKIATELGVNIDADKDGRVNLDQLGLLLDALKSTNVGRVGNSFEDQLDFFRRGQDLQGNSGTLGGFNGLLDFLRNVGGVTALNGVDLSDPAAARQALMDLFVSLNNSTGVAAGGLGALTGGQFADLLEDMIRGLENLGAGGGGGGAGAGAGGGSSGGNTGPTLPGVGDISMPDDMMTGGPALGVPAVAISLSDVVASITSMSAETTSLLTKSLDAQLNTASNTATTVAKLDTIIELIHSAHGRAGTADDARARELAEQVRLYGGARL